MRILGRHQCHDVDALINNSSLYLLSHFIHIALFFPQSLNSSPIFAGLRLAFKASTESRFFVQSTIKDAARRFSHRDRLLVRYQDGDRFD